MTAVRTPCGGILASLRPEERLILACARTPGEGEDGPLIASLLDGALRWDCLEAAARRHGMGQLIWWRLRWMDPGVVPQAVRDRLSRRFRETARANLLLTGELLELARLAGERGLAPVAFKGPVLAATAYGSLALRPFSDLDLLVPRRELPAFAELLVARGYRLDGALWHVIRAAPRLPTRFLSDAISFSRDDRAMVECHLLPAHHYLARALDTAALLRRKVPFSLGGRMVWTLRPEDHILYLAVHGCKHRWERILWLADVAWFVVSRPQLDWDELYAEADRRGSARMLSLALALAADGLGLALPPAARERIRADRAIPGLISGVVGGWTGPETVPELSWQNFRWFLGLWDRPGKKLGFAARFVATPANQDFSLTPLPVFLFPAYYLLRLFRMTGRHLLSPLVRFLRGSGP